MRKLVYYHNILNENNYIREPSGKEMNEFLCVAAFHIYVQKGKKCTKLPYVHVVKHLACGEGFYNVGLWTELARLLL